MPIYSPGKIILNKYRIEKQLGQGAFGEVYLATHLKLGPRALKVLRRDLPGVGNTVFRQYQARFELEARLGDMINHSNVIQVKDFDQAGNELVLAMEFAPGGSLQDWLDQAHMVCQPMSYDKAVKMAFDLGSGLAALHNRDIVHRDLKPANILFGSDGSAKVGDLGVAQIPGGMTQRTHVDDHTPHHPGTPDYMSPEQVGIFSYLTPASDMYSLGVVLFLALTLRNPKNLKPGTRLRALRPDAPQWLDDLLAEMLERDPEKRLFDGAELVRKLTQAVPSLSDQPRNQDLLKEGGLLGGKPAENIPDESTNLVPRPFLSRLTPVGLVIVFLLLFLALIFWLPSVLPAASTEDSGSATKLAVTEMSNTRAPFIATAPVDPSRALGTPTPLGAMTAAVTTSILPSGTSILTVSYTPIPTSTMRVIPTVLIRSFTYLYGGPSNFHRAVGDKGYNPGEPVKVLNKEPANKWVMVQVAGGVVGWVPLSSLDPGIDLSSVPLIEMTPTNPPTAIPPTLTKRPTNPPYPVLRSCPPGTGPGGITAGDYPPESLTPEQRQWLWEAFGHAGYAPVGYGGENCQK